MSNLPKTIEQAAVALRAGEVSSVELVETSIARAEALDSVLGTYIIRFDEEALAAANAFLAAWASRTPETAARSVAAGGAAVALEPHS
jgi:aspartyl-tRNA(Asn)/glutamyl-tRNA(Gln) amidotransferase subunit A